MSGNIHRAPITLVLEQRLHTQKQHCLFNKNLACFFLFKQLLANAFNIYVFKLKPSLNSSVLLNITLNFYEALFLTLIGYPSLKRTRGDLMISPSHLSQLNFVTR